jgi:hypothetical protein
MQNFSYGDSAQYKSAVNTWTSLVAMHISLPASRGPSALVRD